MWVNLTEVNGLQLCVNTDALIGMHEEGGHTQLYFTNSTIWSVREKPEELFDKPTFTKPSYLNPQVGKI